MDDNFQNPNMPSQTYMPGGWPTPSNASNTGRTAEMDDTAMIIPIALREGVSARVQLPANITEAEAQKIARVVLAYASELEH